MTDEISTCPSCGARVPEGADACDLCGTSVSSPSSDESEDLEPDSEDSPDTADEAADRPGQSDEASSGGDYGGSIFCNNCGWENPGDANYCSQCGSELDTRVRTGVGEGTRPVSADLPTSSSDASGEDAPPPEASSETSAMGRQIVMVVGGALLLVLGLFFATQWSQQYDWADETGEAARAPEATSGSGAGRSQRAGRGEGTSSEPTASGQGAAGAPEPSLDVLVDKLGGSVDGPVANEIDSLRAELDAAEGAEQRELKSQLVRLYTGAGTPGRAAQVQVDLADQTGSVKDRRRAADLLYKWMRQVESEGDRSRVANVARHVAEAYASVVDRRPEDLDARTRMGEAYLLTNNPMKGIEAINSVLDEDSTFVPARFQKGLALLQINRLDQALRQFEMVMDEASEEDPFYQQAQRAITVIRKETEASGSGAE